ncbi:MAG: beta-ketoacyl synthase chain length factor [Candidatus Competibacteraceae bacterium]
MVKSPDSSVPLQIYVNAIGLCAPGLSGWSASHGVLTGRSSYREEEMAPLGPLSLPRNDARRASFNARLALQVAQEALAGSAVSSQDCCSVFACAGGNTEALDHIFIQLAGGARVLSPTHFINTIHNVAAGYWSLAAGSTAPYTSLAAYDASFGAGLLEAACMAVIERCAVLLVAYDVPPPPPLLLCRPVRKPFGVALLFSARCYRSSFRRLELTLVLARSEDRLPDPGLEALRMANPAARSLPLLVALAAVRPGPVILPYLSELQLQVRCNPC